MCAFQDDEENYDYHLEVQTVAETDDLFAEHSDDDVLVYADAATPRFTRQEAWDRERFFLGQGPGTDNPLGHEREACFVCMVWLPETNVREGFDFWRIHGIFSVVPPRGVVGDFMDIPHERYYVLCRQCVQDIFDLRAGPRRWTSRPFYEVTDQDRYLGRRNTIGGERPSIFGYTNTLPREGTVIPRGMPFVYDGIRPPPPPPRPPIQRVIGPQERHMIEAPWRAHGPRGDGDSSGDGEVDEYQYESDGSENPWADVI